MTTSAASPHHGKHIASSTLWQVASQGAMAVLSIITVKFVAIGLSKELAGNYQSAYGFLQMFGILADFGLYAVAVREIAAAREEERDHVFGTLFTLRFIILCLSLGVALLFTWLMPLWRGTPLPLAITIASTVPFFTLLAGILRTIFQVHYKMKAIFIAEVAQRIVTVSLIGWFVLRGVRGTEDIYYLYAFLATGGIGAAVLLILSVVQALPLQSIRPHWDTTLLKKMFKHALPFGLAYFCMTLYRQTDITMIALLRDDWELQNAYYGFALRAGEMAYLLPTFLLNSTLPILTARHERGEDTRHFMGTVFFSILLLMFTAALTSFIWARPLMALLTTPEYLSSIAVPAGSDTALRLLSIPMLLNGIVLFAFYSLLTVRRGSTLVKMLLWGALLSIVMNLLLIPPFGFVGAIATSIAVHILLVALLLPSALAHLPMHFTRTHLRMLTLFVLALGTLLALFRPFVESAAHTVLWGTVVLCCMVIVVRMIGIDRLLRK